MSYLRRVVAALLFFVGGPLFADLPSGITWETRHAGADTNGGGYVPGSSGTDFSQQSAAQVAYTDMVLGSGGTTYTSVASPVGNTLPGNIVQIISGSGCTPGFYEVASNATITATLDRSAGSAASVCTANLGGALGTLAGLNTAMNTTPNITQLGWVKADATYSISTLVSFNMTGQAHGTSIQVSGYTSTRGDNGQPTIQATAVIVMVQIANNNGLSNMTFRNFILDCNANATTGFQFQGNGNTAENMHVENCVGSFGVNFGTYNSLICRNCWVSNCLGTGFTVGNSGETESGEYCIWCMASGNTGVGFTEVGSFTCYVCIAAANTGDGFNLSPVNQGAFTMMSSVAYNNGRDGLRWIGDGGSANTMLQVFNSAFTANTGWGINNTGSTTPIVGYNVFENYNGFFSNGAGAVNNLVQGGGDVALSGNPFTNPGSLNFALNNTAGAGAALQGVGFPGILMVGGTGALDIGALQHTVTGGSGGGSFAFVQ